MVMIQDLSGLIELLSIQKITVYGMFLLIIYLLWRENKQLKAKIEKVHKNHIDDLKQSQENEKTMMETWHAHTSEMKDIIRLMLKK